MSCAVRIRDPSGLNDADPMYPLLPPFRVRSSTPVFASHTVAIWFMLAVTIREPSRLNAADTTSVGRPSERLRVSSSAPVVAFQTLAVPLEQVVTIRKPSGLN